MENVWVKEGKCRVFPRNGADAVGRLRPTPSASSGSPRRLRCAGASREPSQANLTHPAPPPPHLEHLQHLKHLKHLQHLEHLKHLDSWSTSRCLIVEGSVLLHRQTHVHVLPAACLGAVHGDLVEPLA